MKYTRKERLGLAVSMAFVLYFLLFASTITCGSLKGAIHTTLGVDYSLTEPILRGIELAIALFISAIAYFFGGIKIGRQ